MVAYFFKRWYCIFDPALQNKTTRLSLTAVLHSSVNNNKMKMMMILYMKSRCKQNTNLFHGFGKSKWFLNKYDIQSRAKALSVAYDADTSIFANEWGDVQPIVLIHLSLNNSHNHSSRAYDRRRREKASSMQSHQSIRGAPMPWSDTPPIPKEIWNLGYTWIITPISSRYVKRL